MKKKIESCKYFKKISTKEHLQKTTFPVVHLIFTCTYGCVFCRLQIFYLFWLLILCCQKWTHQSKAYPHVQIPVLFFNGKFSYCQNHKHEINCYSIISNNSQILHLPEIICCLVYYQYVISFLLFICLKDWHYQCNLKKLFGKIFNENAALHNKVG